MFSHHNSPLRTPTANALLDLHPRRPFHGMWQHLSRHWFAEVECGVASEIHVGARARILRWMSGCILHRKKGGVKFVTYFAAYMGTEG